MAKMKTLIAIVAALASLAVACTEGSADDADRTVSPTAERTTPSMASGGKRSDVLRLEPNATIHTRGPQGLETAFGSVWTTNEFLDTVTRVDPISNQVVASIDVRGVGPQTLAATGDAIWVNGGGGMVRIDPATNRVVDRIGGSFGDIAAGFGSVWAIQQDGVLLRIDPTSGDVMDRIGTRRRETRLRNTVVVGSDSVWVSLTAARTVQRIQPGDDRIVATFRNLGPAPRILAVEERVWLLTGFDYFSASRPTLIQTTLTRLDPMENELVSGSSIDISTEAWCIPRPEADLIWFGCQDGMLYAYDLASERVTRSFDLSEGKGYGAGFPTVAYGSMWTTSLLANRIRRWSLPPG